MTEAAARTLRVTGGATLSGHVTVPPDKSISHRALMLAALGRGRCEVSPLSFGADNQTTLRLLSDLGVPIEVEGDRAFVTGVETPRAFREAGVIDCGNSGTTMRLMTGILAGAGRPFTMTGDASLVKRPMSRLLPLEKMGARLTGREEGGKIYPPITIEGRELVGCRHELSIASAQVKSALLLAGLFAEGETTVLEPRRSRDHTERMLRGLGVAVTENADMSLTVSKLAAPWSVPAIHCAPDPSSAAFLLAAAALTGSADLVVRSSVNPTRAGFVDALRAMGMTVEENVCSDMDGEPVADLRVTRGALAGAEIGGDLALRAIDELPLIAGIAAFASGRTVIRDAAELRVKESDRIATTHRMLEAFGVSSTETVDGLIIEGGQPTPGRFSSQGDHRMAMTAVVMGLGTSGTSTIEGAEAADVSFPGFASQLAELGAKVEEISG